jgi:hypothetical protein
VSEAAPPPHVGVKVLIGTLKMLAPQLGQLPPEVRAQLKLERLEAAAKAALARAAKLEAAMPAAPIAERRSETG